MMRVRTWALTAASAAALSAATVGSAGAVDLNTFGVLAATAITNTGIGTTIDGNVGLYPNDASSITGFALTTVLPPWGVYAADGVSQQAQADLGILFTNLSNSPTPTDLTGNVLGVDIVQLTPGVYSFDNSGASVNGTLTLNAEGDPNAKFVIISGSTLTTAAASSIVLINGAQGANVYWVVDSSATLGTGSTFSGQILAYAAISFGDSVTINCGAAWAQTAAVTLINDTITAPGAEACAFGGFGSGGSDTTTGNAGAIAAALDAYVSAGGILPPGLQALLNGLTPEQLTDALTQLSGEVGTGAAPAATGGMNSFLSTLFDSAFPEDRMENPARGPATVKALGYASERAPSPGIAAALGSLDPSLVPGRWGIWAAGYGGYSVTRGDSTIGTHEQSDTTFGLSAGFDQRVGASSIVGVAFGTGRTNFSVAEGLGSGSDSMLQAALYARSNLGHAYVAGAVAYSYNDFATARDINLPTTPPTTDHFSASFAGHDVAGQVEVGYRMAWLIPYAAARAQALFTPAYSETASGTSGLGLNYAAQTTTALRTELGARIEQTIAQGDAARLTLRARAAWAHDYGSAPYVTAAFETVPDAPFRVAGAAPARDSMLLSAGAELGFANGFAISGLFDSAFSANSEMYSGTGRVSYRW
jgi:outer membrane autotransporter protein